MSNIIITRVKCKIFKGRQQYNPSGFFELLLSLSMHTYMYDGENNSHLNAQCTSFSRPLFSSHFNTNNKNIQSEVDGVNVLSVLRDSSRGVVFLYFIFWEGRSDNDDGDDDDAIL